jgi:hypothetical protein
VPREYAVIADGERGAVLDPQGRIVWLCAPRRHDDAVFSALIGGPGHFTRATMLESAVRLAGVSAPP